MLSFLRAFVYFLYVNGVLPPEYTTVEGSEENTYLMFLPDEPDTLCSVIPYDSAVPTIGGKGFGVIYLQIIFRSLNHEEVLNKINKLFEFLSSRTEFIEDIDENYWVIIDTVKLPTKLENDEKGRYRYSLSFPVTTKI